MQTDTVTPNAPASAKPLPAAPKPRVEKNAATYLARVTKAVEATIGKATSAVDPYLDAQLTGTLKIATTDGHRMVIVEGTGKQRIEKLFTFLQTRPTTAITLDPEFHSALRRMKAAASAKHPTVILRLDPLTVNPVSGSDTANLRLAVRNIDDQVEAWEDLTVTGTNLRRAEAILNIRYIDDVLGRWPVTLRIGEPTERVIFENEVLTYVLMPFQDGRPLPDNVVDDVVNEPWLTAPKPGTLPAKTLDGFWTGAAVRFGKREGTIKELVVIAGKTTKKRTTPERHRARVAYTDAKGSKVERFIDLTDLTLVDMPEPTEPKLTTIQLPDARLVDAENAYSADRIAEDGKRPVRVLKVDGRLFTTVGGGYNACGYEGYELLTVEAFTALRPDIPIQSYSERSKSQYDDNGRPTPRPSYGFYPGMKVSYQKQTYVLGPERFEFIGGGAARPAPEASRPVSRPSAAKSTSPTAPAGATLRWRYEWTEYKTKEKVSGEVEAVNEKLARAAIRQKHGFEKWLPDRTKVTCLGQAAA